MVAVGSTVALIEWPLHRNRERLDPPYADDVPAAAVPERWEWVARTLGLAVFALVGAAAYFAAVSANRWSAMRAGPAPFVLAPGPAMWLAYAFFAGMFAGLLGASPALRLVAGGPLAESWRRQHRGALVFARRLAIWVMLPFTVFVLLSLGVHARLDEQGVAVQRFAEFRTAQWRWDQVKRLVRVTGVIAPSGEHRERPHLVVELVRVAH